MSVLSKLNPVNWVKNLLISDYVGAAIRHVLTSAGTLLLTAGWAKAPVVLSWQEATLNLLTSPEFLSGLAALVFGATASVANKKVP